VDACRFQYLKLVLFETTCKIRLLSGVSIILENKFVMSPR